MRRVHSSRMSIETSIYVDEMEKMSRRESRLNHAKIGSAQIKTTRALCQAATYQAMPAGPSTLASIFASPGASRKDSAAGDSELARAIKLSEEEARLSKLSEDELLQKALEASRAESETKGKRSRSGSPHPEEKVVPKKVTKLQTFGQIKAADDDDQELTFTPESFGEKEEIINRLNGSLDLIYCKGWIRREERMKLREWMLRELTWHRVSKLSHESESEADLGMHRDRSHIPNPALSKR